MLMGKDFLMPRAQIANLLMMDSPHMAVEVRPSQARHIAVAIRTIVSEEQYCILHNLITLIPDAIIVIRECDISV